MASIVSLTQYYNKTFKSHEMVPLLGISRPVLVHRLWVGADPALFFSMVADVDKEMGLRVQRQLRFDHSQFQKEIDLGYYRMHMPHDPSIWVFDYLYGCALKTVISETHILRSKYDDYHGAGKLAKIMQSILDENRKTIA